MSRLYIDMSKQLIDRKQQGYLIAQMNGSVKRLS